MKLGKHEKIDIREIWSGEATDFTPWISKEENIAILSETINIELEVEDQEKNVGAFRADILCKDTISDNYVLIENQLERTDHNHLGQLLTYAAGLDAVTIIWIAKNFTEEHRATIDWLNRITDDKINFFGIEIEVYKIGESLPAPMFQIIAKPNDWSKTIKRTAQTTKLTDTKILQQEYWTAMKNHFETVGSIIKCQKPKPQHWMNMALGRSHFYLCAIVSMRDNFIRIELIIDGNEAKNNFHKLKNLYEEDPHKNLSKELSWNELPNAKISTVNMKKFDKYFRPKVKEL